MFTLYVKDVWIGLNMSKSNVGKKEGTRLSLKCSAWKGFINFALRKFCVRNFCSKNNLVPKSFGLKKRFCLKKFWSEKILVRNFFWTNKIFGLKSLGPKKFWIWKKIGVQNKI